MNFFRRSELNDEADGLLAAYDREILGRVGADYPYPVRMRDWELYRVLRSLDGLPAETAILEAGSFNTYLGLYLARDHPRVVVSDLLWPRILKSLLRAVGAAPAKKTEAGYFAWRRIMRRHGLRVRNIDLTRIPAPDGCFDRVIAISVIEHIRDVERAVSEMYRVLAPGGRLVVTTDCAPEAKPLSGGVRYFSESELRRIFAGYADVSASNRPDFSSENWCYGGRAPVVTAFAEIAKPAPAPRQADPVRAAETRGG